MSLHAYEISTAVITDIHYEGYTVPVTAYGTNIFSGTFPITGVDSNCLWVIQHPDWSNLQGVPTPVNGTNGLQGIQGSQGIQGVAGSNSPSHQFFQGTRTLNTSFIVSSNTDAIVKYSVDIASSLSLSGGTIGGILLETSTNNSNWSFYDGGINANVGALTIGLNTWQTNTITVSGCIPAGMWIRVKSTNILGSPIFNYRSGNETWF